MRAFPVLALVLATPLAASDRIAVRVVDPSGERPLAGAGVACADPAGPGATVGGDGRIPVLAACKKVRCWAEGYLPGEADVAGPMAECRVTGAARLDGTVSGLASAGGVEGRLYALGTLDLAAREPLAAAAEGALPRVLLGPVAAGSYRLDLVRVTDGWRCRADLGPLAHGTHSIRAAWRDPVPVKGKVFDGEGVPVEKIAVRMWDRFPETEPATNRRPARVDPLGLWSCGPSSPLKGSTGPNGEFSFPADPKGPVLLAAGTWDDPLGVAARSFPEPPGNEVILRPERPVRVAAAVADEDDRPVPCRAALTVRSAESAWLAKRLPGATLEGPCGSDGTIRLGPFLSSEWELYVRPQPGLPLRLRGGAPLPGTTEDLGTIRVSRGVAVTVDVFDGDGGPVERARVLGSGSAGVVFNVEAYTDFLGRADLAGFPEGARLRLEVSADGYRSVSKDGLEISPTPYRVELERSAVVEGGVVGESGESVPGAEVLALDDGGDLAARTTSGPEGTFRISDSKPGSIRLIAHARGYRRSEAVPLAIEAGEIRSGVVLTLARAEGIRGTVTDPSGTRVAGATVFLVRDHGTISADPVTSIAASSTGPEGRFVLDADPQPQQSLVATAPGFGAAVESSPLAKTGTDIPLTLAPAGSLEVHLPADLPPARIVSVKDGRRVAHTASTAGRTRVLFPDLAVGKGEAALPPGSRKGVEIAEKTTTVVDLRDGVTVEGTVTNDGRPLPHFVVAIVSLQDGGIAMAGVVETDARGNWRIENMAPGRYLFSAIGPGGRAEKRIELPAEGLVRVDLAVVTVIVDASVTDAKTKQPVAGASLVLQPPGSPCQASMSTRSWGNLFDTDVDIAVSDGGCGFGSTSADGRVRIVLASAGPVGLRVDGKRYRTYEGEVTLLDGVNELAVPLEPEPGPRVRVTMKTDPPGLPGTLECIAGAGQSRHSFGGVSGTQECPLGPGPGEVIFRVDGYGIGHRKIVVPDEGDLDVTVTAVRCGQLLISRRPESTARPVVRDAAELDWGGVLSRTAGGAIQAVETPELGPAWLLRYLPPGIYDVELDGRSRGTVAIEAGVTANLP